MASEKSAEPAERRQPFGVDIDLVEGTMSHPDNHVVRRASDVKGHYADQAAARRLISEQGNPVLYEVFEKNIPKESGHLRLCISKLYPGRVGDECFMTMGHYHAVRNTAEIYVCIRGRGYILMMTAAGECVAEPMQRNRVVYVPPHWAHRAINTGDEPLISLCVYPGEAGHDYQEIAEKGFLRRVFIRDGREVIE